MRFLKSILLATLVFGAVLSLSPALSPALAADPPAGEVHAEGDGAKDGHGKHEANLNPLQFHFGEAFWNLAVFLVLLGVLAKFVFPAIRDGLNAREQKLKGDLEAAEQAKADAQKSLDEYKAQLADARKEAQAIVAEARAAAQQAANADKAKIEAEMMQMKDNAKRDIAAAREQAMSDIYAQAAGLSTSIAGKILRREISADDQQALVNESVEQFKGSASSN